MGVRGESMFVAGPILTAGRSSGDVNSSSSHTSFQSLREVSGGHSKCNLCPRKG